MPADSHSDRSATVSLFGQRVIHACPCGATADGEYPERLIHRGNCPWDREQTRAVTVVLAADYDTALARLRAENERYRAVAESLAAALGAWCPGSRVLAEYRAAYPAKETP